MIRVNPNTLGTWRSIGRHALPYIKTGRKISLPNFGPGELDGQEDLTDTGKEEKSLENKIKSYLHTHVTLLHTRSYFLAFGLFCAMIRLGGTYGMGWKLFLAGFLATGTCVVLFLSKRRHRNASWRHDEKARSYSAQAKATRANLLVAENLCARIWMVR